MQRQWHGDPVQCHKVYSIHYYSKRCMHYHYYSICTWHMATNPADSAAGFTLAEEP